MNTRRSGVIGLTALLACAGICHADVKTFNESQSTEFHDPLNWTPSGVPTDEDRIVIESGDMCDVVEGDNQQVEFTIDTMDVQGGGTLNIDDGITLIVENDDDNVGEGLGPTVPDHSIVAGTVNVGDSTGGTLFVKNLWIDLDEHVFSGSGTLNGAASGSVIKVQEDETFTSLLGASGTGGILDWFTIEADSGTATFNNEGRLIADDDADIVLESSLILDDVAGAIWGLDHCESVLTFKRAASLDGDVVMFGHDGTDKDGGGVLVFDAANDAVSTGGTHVIENTCPRREYDFASGASFEYDKFACSIGPSTCSTCGNPCDDCSGNPYVVDTDKVAGNCTGP